MNLTLKTTRLLHWTMLKVIMPGILTALMMPLPVCAADLTEKDISPRADSVLRLIPTLKGEEQLKAWRQFIDYDEIYFDTLLAPQMVNHYIKACQIQKDVEREAAARKSRIYINFNFNRIDAMRQAFLEDSVFLTGLGKMDQLFIEWAQFPQAYVNVHNISKAQQTSQQLYEEAQRQQNVTGLGVGAFCFGYLYESLGNDSLSIDWYKRSYKLLRGSANYSSFHETANKLCDALNKLGRCQEVINTCVEWRLELDKVFSNPEYESTADTYAYYMFGIDNSEADACIALGRLDQAEQLLKHAAGQHAYIPKSHEMSLNHSLAMLFKEKGEWAKAYEHIRKCVPSDLRNVGFSQLPRLKLMGECLLHLGRYEEAGWLLLNGAVHSDTLYSQRVARQLSEMQTLYEIDELKNEQRLQKQRQRFTTGGIALVLGVATMLILISVNGRWRKRLETKNRQLQRERDIVVTQNKQLIAERNRAEEATMAKAQIEAEKKRIDGELQIARNIQLGMLPKALTSLGEEHGSVLDLFASMTPAREVGGDLYDYAIVDGKLYFCVGDVSGKGVPASLFMTTTVNLFRASMQHKMMPAQIANLMNRTLTESNDAGMFVTMFIGLVDLETGHLDFCNCGHNPPVLNDFLKMESNAPLGLWSEVEYVGEEIEDIGDSPFFIYTDGLNEAENQQQKQFGDDHIRTLLQGHPSESCQEIVEMMKLEVEHFTAGAEQSDDLTMLCLRIKK